MTIQEMLFREAEKNGFSDVEVYFEKKEVFGCKVYKGEIDQYEIAEDGGLSFRGKIDGKMGYAYTEKLDEASISFLIRNARENAEVLNDEEGEELFPGSGHYEQGNFYSESLESVSIAEKIEFIKEVERELLAFDPRIQPTDYCMIRNESVTRTLSNNKGLHVRDRLNFLYAYVEAIVKEGEEIKTAFEFTVTKDFNEMNAKALAKRAAESAIAQLGSRSIENKHYPVLLRNDAAANLLAVYSVNFSAEEAQAGKSPLHDKGGKAIASGKVTIVDDPFLGGGVGCRTFDSEGVATRKLTVVKSGILQTLLHNQKTAKKSGTETTGHANKQSYKSAIKVGPSNFYIEPSSKEFEELLGGMDEGVLITELSGLHSGTNAISGDFSVAANGFYVKDGKVQYPVNLMTIAGNFYDMMAGVEEVGSDLIFPLSPVGSPSILVRSLSVTVE
ncbi:TldD/PmbA family protein [Neobacillus notoginsengisoli]|uniref:TldD/PmbA family protein n=1 Tax=Neobacillus notoginsengisoli TaxID=1578198 RepID=A0A417YW90_9BACI|nr:TldD/PmbA family protein [Neobacillus notoginsengisoli]RHW41625.1 TldD/PmbA family protein [Neobacillus notoginsengisoli]